MTAAEHLPDLPGEGATREELITFRDEVRAYCMGPAVIPPGEWRASGPDAFYAFALWMNSDPYQGYDQSLDERVQTTYEKLIQIDAAARSEGEWVFEWENWHISLFRLTGRGIYLRIDGEGKGAYPSIGFDVQPGLKASPRFREGARLVNLMQRDFKKGIGALTTQKEVITRNPRLLNALVVGDEALTALFERLQLDPHVKEADKEEYMEIIDEMMDALKYGRALEYVHGSQEKGNNGTVTPNPDYL